MAMLSAYTKLDRVGRGSYGEVWKVRRHSDGVELVMKEVSMVGISEQEEREILNETSCMMQLSHPHIVAYVGSFLEHGSLHIVMELASGGDLQCLIRRQVQKNTFILEERLWKFLIQLTQGLQHAHSRRILHRDIKASNVFIDANDNIKIGDLGLGKILGESRCAVSQVGTPIYMSPEMCEGKPYDTKSDVWALGCLMFELAVLKPPFQAANQALLVRKIINEAPELHVPNHYSREIPFIINKLLDKDPRRRPSPDSILNYSAVQIRLERARFQQREAELLEQLEEARRQDVRRAIEHSSKLQQYQQQQQLLHQQSGETILAEVQAEREKFREARERAEERERESKREHEDLRQREAALLTKCKMLERERDKEREAKQTVVHQLNELQQRLRKYEDLQHTPAAASDSTREFAPENGLPQRAAGSPSIFIDTQATYGSEGSEGRGGLKGETSQKEEDQDEESLGTGQTLHMSMHDRKQTDAALRIGIHGNCGSAGSAVRSKGRDPVPMPTPNKLFVSPRISSPNNNSALTPSRGADNRVSQVNSVVEKSVENAAKVRLLLTRRSWGEGDVVRSGRQDIPNNTPSSATPLRGPMRASADSMTLSSSCGLSEKRRVQQKDQGISSKQQWCKVDGEQRERYDEENRIGNDGDEELSEEAETSSAVRIPSVDTVDMSDVIAFRTPTRATNITPAKSNIAGESTDSSKSKGGCMTPSVHTPSASVLTGCIRARQRTPLTSLGPAKRVLLSERIPLEDCTNISRDLEVDSALSRRHSDGNSGAEKDGWGAGEDDHVPLPKFSRSSPKGLELGGGFGALGGSEDDDDVAMAAADVWALTEGLRRSAQIALNASNSSSSGSG